MIAVSEVFNDVMPIIRKASPLLAGLIGGPAGVVLSHIIPILADAFEAHPDNLKELVDNILKDPDAQKKLCKIEGAHKDKFAALADNANNLSEAEINIKLKFQPD
jgi:hypothetical protein